MKGKNILYGTGLYLLSLWALYGKKSIRAVGARLSGGIMYQPGRSEFRGGSIGKDDGGYKYRELSRAGRGESVYAFKGGMQGGIKAYVDK